MTVALNAIHQGDCIEWLAKLQAGSIDLAFADPPFNIGYEYDVYEDRRAAEDYLAWSQQWIAGVHRALKPDGTFWLAIGDEFAAELKLIAQKDVGFHCRSWVIWYYTFGVNCARKFTRSHVHLFHFVKDPRNFTFNAQDPAIRIPSARQLVYADSRANPNGRLPDDTWILRPQDLPEGFTPDGDVWYFSRVAGTFKERAGFHGCQMPERLLARIISACSNPGEVVLDPFSGSGSTLVAAKKLHRQWLGFELSKDYAARISERLAAVSPGDELVGASDPLKSAPSTAKGKRLKGVTPQPVITSPAKPIDTSSAASITTSSIELRDCGIIEAFRRASEGYSVDRLIADPDLNAEFIRWCNQLGIPGAPSFWNRRLLALRKASQLEVPTTRTTKVSRTDLDVVSFASEIAWSVLSEDHWSLDDIFCDPSLAARFDALARDLAPGYSPLLYRWAAISIRKRADKWRQKPVTDQVRLPRSTRLRSLDPAKYRGVHGAYVLRSANQSIYVGEADDLGRRLEKHFETIGLSMWSDHQVECVSLPTLVDPSFGVTQACLINHEKTRPPLNTSAFRIHA